MQRDLLSTGIKILGLYLMVLGLLEAGRNAVLAVSFHRRYAAVHEPWISENVPADLRAQIMQQNKMSRDVQRMNLQTQKTGAAHAAVWALVQAAAGLAIARMDRMAARVLGAAPEAGRGKPAS